MITAKRISKALAKHATRAWLKLRAAGGSVAKRFCPACDHDVVGFFRYGAEAEWGCPICGASPRERLMHALLNRDRIIVPPMAAILHCAPNETSLVQRFRGLAADYVPADIDPSRYDVSGMQKLDLMTMTDSDRFDIIYASHVLEHVPDDARVLRNIARALKPGGEAWLIVPLWNKPTEDGEADMPGREREQRYGQWDHIRHYGPDFANRIAAAGLRVETVDARALPADTARRMALGDTLFCARRMV